MSLLVSLKYRLEKLKNGRVKIENMSSLHVVEHGFYDMDKDFSPMFYGNKDKICYGLDSAGDLSGAFKMVKKALLKEIDFDIEQVENMIKDLGDRS